MNRRDFLKAELALAATVGSGLLTVSTAQAADKPHRTAIKTLLIASHPYPERSVTIKGLQQAAESVDGVTVRNLETIYGFDTRAIKAGTSANSPGGMTGSGPCSRPTGSTSRRC
ncbi:twin-arginine translocation signal domain-containing protein [Pandoraea nosoerga]|uniref:twin-arginine translocation signal domain-containing protein n=1 Tax=Pandoraea nosoerga TaxID=2508296 RepID=UPI00197D12DC|nr:twin-arginine translocation signal domain-containing protein [Pandoraea nosoerga]